MRVIVAAICLILTCNCLAAHPRGGGGSPPTATEIPDSLFEQAIACIKRFEGWHGKHLPYVGWGHKLLPGETFRPDMSKAQADSLLRADLRKLCRMCSRFGKDALLLSEISDNKIESFPNCWNIAQNFRRSFRRSASACRFVMVRAEYLSPGCNRCPYPTYG